MKQVLVRGGGVAVEDVPAPGVAARRARPGRVVVRQRRHGVGERRDVGAAALPARAEAARAREGAGGRAGRGVRAHRQADPRAARGGAADRLLGAGVVVEVGAEVEGFAPGDRVACAGAGIANHAELIEVPVNLAVRVPDGVGLDAASTVTLGAIALQGVRRAAPALGETVGVIGLGILGQLTVQLLAAAGLPRRSGPTSIRRRVALAVATAPRTRAATCARRR